MLRAKFPGIWVSGDTQSLPAGFPAATISETSNSVYERMRTTKIENAARIMIEVNAYSNKIGYKKSEAKSIAAAADTVLAELGFTRITMNPTTNLQDATIYRITARYEAVIVPEYSGKDITTYRIHTP